MTDNTAIRTPKTPYSAKSVIWTSATVMKGACDGLAKSSNILAKQRGFSGISRGR
jgi:hypothetical protein